MSNIIIFLIVFGGASFILATILIVKTVVVPRRLIMIEKLIESGNTKAAIRRAKNFIARNERNPDIHFYLGECYRIENKIEPAIVEYKHITNTGKYTNIAAEPEIRKRLAEGYLKLGQLDEAQKEYILLSKIEPDEYEHYYNIARLFEERNYTDSALNNYKKVISINSHHVESLERIGIILYRKKIYNDAKKYLMLSLKYNPQRFSCYYYLGKISKIAGDYNTALTQFEKAQKDTDLRQWALFERANIFITKGDIQHAIFNLERALNMGDTNTSAILGIRYLLARCYEENRDLIKAVEQWDKISQINPKYKDVAEKLATYSELRMNDNIKDFFTASQSQFQKLCREIVQHMGFAVQDVMLKDQDLVKIFALETQSRWRNAKKALTIIKIYRNIKPIGYDVIRSLYEEMRKSNAMRSVCISSSKFTRSAVEFAQIRPIDLIDREELIKLLGNVIE